PGMPGIGSFENVPGRIIDACVHEGEAGERRISGVAGSITGIDRECRNCAWGQSRIHSNKIGTLTGRDIVGDVYLSVVKAGINDPRVGWTDRDRINPLSI